MVLEFGCAWVPLLLMTVQWLYVSALLVRKRSMMFSQTKHSDCRVCTFRFLACMPLPTQITCCCHGTGLVEV